MHEWLTRFLRRVSIRSLIHHAGRDKADDYPVFFVHFSHFSEPDARTGGFGLALIGQ